MYYCSFLADLVFDPTSADWKFRSKPVLPTTPSLYEKQRWEGRIRDQHTVHAMVHFLKGLFPGKNEGHTNQWNCFTSGSLQPVYS